MTVVFCDQNHCRYQEEGEEADTYCGRRILTLGPEFPGEPGAECVNFEEKEGDR